MQFAEVSLQRVGKEAMENTFLTTKLSPSIRPKNLFQIILIMLSTFKTKALHLAATF